MDWIPNLFRRGKLLNDLTEEMRLHIEERAEQLMGEGMSPEQVAQDVSPGRQSWVHIGPKSKQSRRDG